MSFDYFENWPRVCFDDDGKGNKYRQTDRTKINTYGKQSGMFYRTRDMHVVFDPYQSDSIELLYEDHASPTLINLLPYADRRNRNKHGIKHVVGILPSSISPPDLKLDVGEATFNWEQWDLRKLQPNLNVLNEEMQKVFLLIHPDRKPEPVCPIATRIDHADFDKKKELVFKGCYACRQKNYKKLLDTKLLDIPLKEWFSRYEKEAKYAAVHGKGIWVLAKDPHTGLRRIFICTKKSMFAYFIESDSQSGVFFMQTAFYLNKFPEVTKSIWEEFLKKVKKWTNMHLDAMDFIVAEETPDHLMDLDPGTYTFARSYFSTLDEERS